MPTGYTTGIKQHPLYHRWLDMRQRCYNPINARYRDYGGRGISVCDEWHDSATFIAWCDETYIEGMTLDRIDNDGDYSPDNCRWADASTQGHNSRTRNTNTSGHRGVNRTPNGGYLARLYINGECLLQKTFRTFEEAVTARQAAEARYL